MDGDTKIFMGEGVPLNSSGVANIFLNTGKKTKLNSPDGTIIHLKTAKPSEHGVHINTTFSIASSKKIKVLFALNFSLAIICIIFSFCVAAYHWKEMVFMQRQLKQIEDQMPVVIKSAEKWTEPPPLKPQQLPELRKPRMDDRTALSEELPQHPRRFYVEDLGEDMLLVDSKKKKSQSDAAPVYDLLMAQKELLVAHFNGAIKELNLGTQGLIGPWVRDTNVSSKNSKNMIELNDNYFTVKESGLYIVYAQVVYFTKAPNCFFVWARTPHIEPRLLATCSTGDDSTARPLDKSQISCAVQTVARLQAGDVINLAQREHYRTVWLREGYSYVGFIKLSS